MSETLGAALFLLLAIALVPVSVLLVQAISAALPRTPAALPGRARPSLAVLVPAHDESTGLMPTLESVMPQLRPGDRLLVVADNCSDDTAQVAAAAGAEVVERHNAARRGKGYALGFGVGHLKKDPPAVVVIVDADCVVAPGTIDRIARLCAVTGRPVQALYLMSAADCAGRKASVAEFAWIVKNLVRPLGFLRLGLPCQLMGTGMAIPWRLLSSVRLASAHLVEDMKMGIDFARMGHPPLFCPDTLVSSRFPAIAEGARAQRTRWEHGHLSVIATEVPRMLVQAVARRGSGLLALALDLSVPPLSLVVLAVTALGALSLACALADGPLAPLWLSGVLALMLGTAIALAWARFGRRAVPAGAFFAAFAYACRKIPLYVRFATRRQIKWERSKRDGAR